VTTSPANLADSVSPAPDLRRTQRRTLAVLSAAQVTSGGGVAVGVALSSLVVAQLSGSVTISGFAGTASVLGTALMALPVARLSTRSGRRAGLALAYGVALAGSAVCALAIVLGNWPLLLAGIVLFGGGSAGNLAARYSAADLSPPGHAARHLSLVIWAGTIGSVAGPNLAEPAEKLGRALGMTGTSGPFALAGVAFAVSVTIIVAGLRPDPLLTARAHAQGPVEQGPVEQAPNGPRRGGGAIRTAWGVLRRSPGARRAIVAIAVAHTAMVSIMSMTPVHLDHGGATIRVIGVVLSVHIAGMYVLSPLVGWLADRIGKIPVLVLGMAQLLAAAALAGTAGEHHVAQVAAGLALLGTGWSCGLVAGSALLTESAPVEHRPSVQGLSDLLMNICGASGTIVAGAIVGSLSYGVLGLAVGALVVATAVWLATGRGRGAVRPSPAEPAG
jgi:MFS family permease